MGVECPKELDHEAIGVVEFLANDLALVVDVLYDAIVGTSDGFIGEHTADMGFSGSESRFIGGIGIKPVEVRLAMYTGPTTGFTHLTTDGEGS